MAQTLAQDPDDPTNMIPLTQGRHSSLNMDLTIGWEFKRFYIFFPPSINLQELKTSNLTLASEGARVNGYYDIVVRQRCVLGQATFNDIRILNASSNVVINITQLLPYDPWERWPAWYNDTVIQVDGTFYTNDSSASPAVALTRQINVVGKE